MNKGPKDELRKQYLKLRGEIQGRGAKSAAVADFLVNSREYASAGVVFAYAAFGSEVDTAGIIERAPADNKTVALPLAQNGVMRFYRVCGPNWRAGLIKSRMGMAEPKPDPENEVFCGSDTLICVPGVVFCRNKHRIGYGGGYYDRYLSAHRPMASVGLCFAAQVADNIETEEFDMPLDAVLTEEGWL